MESTTARIPRDEFEQELMASYLNDHFTQEMTLMVGTEFTVRLYVGGYQGDGWWTLTAHEETGDLVGDLFERAMDGRVGLTMDPHKTYGGQFCPIWQFKGDAAPTIAPEGMAALHVHEVTNAAHAS